MNKWMIALSALFAWVFPLTGHPLSSQADKFIGKFDHVILQDETDVQVQDSGMNFRTEMCAIKVLSDKGCRDYHSVSFFYDPLTMQMSIESAQVEKPDGTLKQIESDSIKSYPMPARAIYWPNIRITIPFGLLEPGDVISYRLKKKGFSYALLEGEVEDNRYAPPMKGHFYDIVSFQNTTPILHKVYSLELPANKPVQYRIFHGEVTPRLEFTDFGMKYVFEKKDIEAVEQEPNMVDISDFGTKLLISTTTKWEDKSEWFYSVNEDFSFKVSDDIQNKVNELTLNCKTNEEKIDILNHWVAHYIRYSGLSMGEGEGFTLHPSDMIMKDRSGVCKDKASLLITFLRAAGLEAFPAMTMAGSRIEDFPADHFNHCVVALRQEDGQFRMLDPTWVPWVREQWSSAEQEQQYLIGYKQGQTLMTTPYSPPEKHYYQLASQSEILENGSLSASFTIEMEGQVDARVRRYLQRNHERECEAYFLEQLKSIWGNVSIKSLSFNDPWDISRKMTVELSFVVPDFALMSEGQMKFKSPALLFTLHDPINKDLNIKFKSDNRKTDIRTRCTKLVKVNEQIKIPKTWKNAVLTPLSNLSETGEFANLTCQSKVEKGHLETLVNLSLNRRIYPAGAYTNLQKILSGIQGAANEFISISPAGGAK